MAARRKAIGIPLGVIVDEPGEVRHTEPSIENAKDNFRFLK
jgi:hypothetical protein